MDHNHFIFHVGSVESRYPAVNFTSFLSLVVHAQAQNYRCHTADRFRSLVFESKETTSLLGRVNSAQKSGL